MTTVKEVSTAYQSLSLTDRLAFCSTLTIPQGEPSGSRDDLLIKIRYPDGIRCARCQSDRIVKNGKRPDGTQRYLCRECGRSFLAATGSVLSGTRKRMETWRKYLHCMAEKKTLRESSSDCGISMGTAFLCLHGVSTKYLGHYLVWHDRMFRSAGKGREEENILFTAALAEPYRIRIQLMYEREGQAPGSASGVMWIDPGVDNLLALSMDNRAEPVLIDGKTVKSFNRYYNKRKAQLQSAADRSNGKQQTAAMRRLTRKRNRRIRDVMHKASRAVVRLAVENGIGTIVIGSNKGWKQEVPLGKQTNQNFVSIPHRRLADMIHYKAALSGIRVIDVEEKYTSGTSYPDGEPPEKAFYDKSRRIRRGLFRSNGGILINADVNAAYQIMKKAGYGTGSIKDVETVRRIQVS